MTYGTTAGALKPLAELTLADPRIETEWYRPHADRALSASDIGERLEKYASLHTGVPERVKSQFEVARNLMLYTYFVFEFQTQAELQAYATLEFALRNKFGNPTREIKKGNKTKTVPLMLGELLQRAIDEKLFQPERLSSWGWTNETRKSFAKTMGHEFDPISAEDWLKFVQQHIVGQRNHIAHGNPHLHLPFSFCQVERCADIINALFPEAPKQAHPVNG